MDISKDMLALAMHRRKKSDSNVKFLFGDISTLSYPSNTFDVATIGYGIRNVEDPRKILKEALRVTKKGGRFVIVEITPPSNKHIRSLAHFYFSKMVPILAKIFSSNSDSYVYLAKSIQEFPTGKKFVEIMKKSGWTNTTYYKFFFGLISIFVGIK